MSIISDIKAVFSPSEALSIGQLASGLCVLPMPKQRPVAPKSEAPTDLFVIDEDRNEFGFNFATAQKQNNGGIPTLTGYDVQLLKERDYWGKNKALQSKNAMCKRLWHSGDTEKEAGVKLGKSESWVEKRYGSFATALLMENGEGES